MNVFLIGASRVDHAPKPLPQHIWPITNPTDDIYCPHSRLLMMANKKVIWVHCSLADPDSLKLFVLSDRSQRFSLAVRDNSDWRVCQITCPVYDNLLEHVEHEAAEEVFYL